MTALSYGPEEENYKLDTYQDTCARQLMIVKTKDESERNNERSRKNKCQRHLQRFAHFSLIKIKVQNATNAAPED